MISFPRLFSIHIAFIQLINHTVYKPYGTHTPSIEVTRNVWYVCNEQIVCVSHHTSSLNQPFYPLFMPFCTVTIASIREPSTLLHLDHPRKFPVCLLHLKVPKFLRLQCLNPWRNVLNNAHAHCTVNSLFPIY